MTVNKKRHEMNVPTRQRKMSATEEERALATAAVGQPEGRTIQIEPFATAQEISRANTARADIIGARTSATEEEQLLAEYVAAGWSASEAPDNVLAGSPTVQGTVITDGGPADYPGFLIRKGGADLWGISREAALGDSFYIWSAISEAEVVLIHPVTSVTTFAGPIGYGNNNIGGLGGTVTQLTSKATAVQIDKVCGWIITHAASLAANTTVIFRVNNTMVNDRDVVIFNRQTASGTVGAYNFWVEQVGVGYFDVGLRNITAGALAEALGFNFAIIKAVAN